MIIINVIFANRSHESVHDTGFQPSYYRKKVYIHTKAGPLRKKEHF